MPGPTEQTLSSEILDFFDGTQQEPFTASEIAGGTGHSLPQVRNELNALVDRGLLQTKEIGGQESVWWALPRDRENDERSVPNGESSDVIDGHESQAENQQLIDQHRQLAQFVTHLNIADDLDEILRQITEEARDLVGAHQSVTSRTINQNWEQAINAVSLSEKYAEYRNYDTRPDGSGIYSLVCERNRPMRMTQDELESHPAWEAFGDEEDEHPPMCGWLAVPIVASDGQNMGLIQLSDKYHGEFTETDEAILVQLANIAAAAIENSRLYDELHESERRYRTLAESFPNGIVTLFDEDLQYTLAAGRTFDELPVTQEAIEGSQPREVWGDDIADALEPALNAALDGEERTVEIGYEGRDWVVRVVPVTNDDGEIFAGMTMAQDITERKRYEAELERALDLLEKTEQIADVAGWEVDPETKEPFWSDHLFDLLDVDYTDQPSLDEALDVYHTEEDRAVVENAVEDALRSGEPFDVEARFPRPSGDVGWLRVQGSPEVEDGEVVSLRGAVQDVTEQKEREQRLEEAIARLEESNERLEQFAYAASHDLQEPLRMVSSYLQLIERRYDELLDEDGKEFLEFAVNGADRMREMIEGLLEYSRVETRGDSFEVVDLDAVLADVLRDLEVKIEESNADISAEELPSVYGDSNQLNQLFQNLLDNAIEYSGDEPPQIRVSAERATDEDEWIISVSDEGIGIDPDDTDRVFEVFESLQAQEDGGTGIGLALCKRIVERHNGEIWVDSEPGEGSTFSFSLPASGS